MKLTVMALEMPARDQPVAVDMGSGNTASENIAPMASQVINAPTATISQRYKPVMRVLPKAVHHHTHVPALMKPPAGALCGSDQPK